MGSNGIGDLNELDFVSGGMYPGSQVDHSAYADPTQLPLAAQAVRADYDPETNPLTGEATSRFAKGGIAALHFDGTEGSQVEEPPAWNPASGQVILQQPVDPKDPFSEMKNTDYTIPKDQIRTFIPDINPLTDAPTGTGAYVLKDGSMLGVDSKGVVGSATPGRNDYKLNEQGYYQPVGANLTWNGGSNTLTKKIGGIDVMVPGQYHKGGYQDDKGNLRVDANGVPIPLLPNYLDSGMGKSGLADAAPYITAAMMAAMTMGASAPASAAMLGGEAAFAGMVPASETLLGSAGYLTPAATSVAPTVTGAETLGSTVAPTVTGTGAAAAPGYGINFGASGASGGINAGALGGSAGITAPSLASLQAGAGLGITEGSALAGLGGAAAKTAGMSTGQKILAGTMAAKALGGGASGGGGGAPATVTTTSAPQQQYPQQQPQLVMSPYITPMNTSGAMYNPMIYNYNTRRAAGGGMMYGNGGGISSLGSYSDGGRLLKGPGDGMSDDIPAHIGQKQPAALADGEFVIPADVVSHLGNGSTDAGAKQLYKMMDKIRQARTGRKSQGKQINPNKFLPKE
jgi:hypothetical protein